MILNFSVSNFGSIKDEQTLSFEAENSQHLEDFYIIKTSKQRILKVALIYGANASGKTTLLQAFNFLRDLVLEPKEKKTEIFNFEPFLFNPTTPQKNTTLSIEFIQNQIKYFYKVEFFKQAIVKEALYYYHPNKANVFKRETNLSEQFTTITFGSKIKIDKTAQKTLESNTLWNNTVLGGYLKTNVNIHELKEITYWFKNYLSSLIYSETDLYNYITNNILNSNIQKANIINILRTADFNISDILIKEEENNLPNKLLKILTTNEKLKSTNLQFEHTVDGVSYQLPYELESQGTKRYYVFGGILSLLIHKSTAFLIDELESSLHPDLYQHFILSFLKNAQKSQLIATTHNREILNNKDIFRDDAIWITDKTASSATQVYSLADFDSSSIRDTTNRLNAYKSGRLGGVPNLGDIYLNFE